MPHEIAELDATVAAAKDYRMALGSDRQADHSPTKLDLQKQIDAIETELKRLQRELGARIAAASGEWVNRWPVLDALYTGNIKLEQIWLPDMKINYNFSSVARYDRCINCHRAIDKTAPGSATEPAYPAIPRDKRDPHRRNGDAGCAAGNRSRPSDEDATADARRRSTASCSRRTGRSIRYAVTIQVVLPESLAAHGRPARWAT